MPRFIMKVNKTDDWYCEWSTIVDNVCRDGSREEILGQLQRQEPTGYVALPGNAPEDRMQRADDTGTSAMFWSPPFEGSWDGGTLMIEQRGTIQRDQLGDYLNAYFAGDDERVAALITPFEDDD